jgi:hypothetical protein
MAEEFKPGQIVPASGVYRITHDTAHADAPHEVTVIKGRGFLRADIARGFRSSWSMRPSTSPKSGICIRRHHRRML